MKIAVIQPSRGLIFAEAQSSLEKALAGYDYDIYRSFTLPIPDCQNALVEEALADDSDYLFFHEEDVVIPEGAIDDMIMAKADIACIDYGVNSYSCITRLKSGEILWCGLGCTLVKREVFERLDKPYFRSDKGLLINDWPKITWINTGEQAYGGQDIWFCMKAREAGFKIEQVSGECKHLQLIDLGRVEINKGLHIIGQKPKISKHQEL